MATYSQTFSELVDVIIELTGRSDRKAQIISFLNQIIRKAQSKQYFFRDLYETQIEPDGTEPYVWTPGADARFRLLRTCYYPNQQVYPKNKPPGRIQQDQDFYYYAAQNYVTFKGAGAEELISVAYYRYLPRLVYYEDADRPAKYDAETLTWEYLEDGEYVSTLGTDALDEAARDKVTNWLLFDWLDLCQDGTLSKLYYLLSDDRGPKHLGLFNDQLNTLLQGESFESLDV